MDSKEGALQVQIKLLREELRRARLKRRDCWDKLHIVSAAAVPFLIAIASVAVTLMGYRNAENINAKTLELQEQINSQNLLLQDRTTRAAEQMADIAQSEYIHSFINTVEGSSISNGGKKIAHLAMYHAIDTKLANDIANISPRPDSDILNKAIALKPIDKIVEAHRDAYETARSEPKLNGHTVHVLGAIKTAKQQEQYPHVPEQDMLFPVFANASNAIDFMMQSLRHDQKDNAARLLGQATESLEKAKGKRDTYASSVSGNSDIVDRLNEHIKWIETEIANLKNE